MVKLRAISLFPFPSLTESNSLPTNKLMSKITAKILRLAIRLIEATVVTVVTVTVDTIFFLPYSMI